jgi:uncharacterized membrane protein YhaH (DUF805 family)
MTDFLGIPKRKWLAFGILSAIFACLNTLISNYIAESILHRPANLLTGFVVVFIGTFALLVIADFLLAKFKEIFNIRTPKRYLAALVFGVLESFGFPSPEFISRAIDNLGLPTFILICVISLIIGFVVSLVLYLLSNFLAGLVFPSIPAKSKSNKTKSKN